MEQPSWMHIQFIDFPDDDLAFYTIELFRSEDANRN